MQKKFSRAVILTVVAVSGLSLAASVFAAKGGKPGRPGGGGGATTCIVKTASPCPSTSTSQPTFTLPENWVVVFSDEFDKPENNADRSGSVDFTRWSTRYPFGSTRINTAGDDDMWNVNTTGLEPGVGWDAEGNIESGMETFMQRLGYTGPDADPQYDVFSNTIVDGTTGNNALSIQAHENPWKNKQINNRKNYLGGMISSHAKPDTDNAHGFEFTYGYVEARARVPQRANGFRAALWLYSDNAYYNEIYGRPDVYEIDFMEYLPNTRGIDADQEECFITQPDVFGISDNKTILTYDTIFQTYHFPGGRTPNNWTFNSSDGYAPERCALDNSGSPIDFGTRNDGWVTYGMLWQPGMIEWYVDGVLINRVDDTSGFSCVERPGDFSKECGTSVYDSRMYLIASMHMGNEFFEGSIDTGAFTSDGGPEFEIDYIKVYQNLDAGSLHSWCGVGNTSSSVCSAR